MTLLKHGGDLKQLEKLVERFKKSGFGLLVKLGEWLGDQLSKKPEKMEKQPAKQQKATELSLEDWRKFRERNSSTGSIR
ncbi:hypothetical protein L6R29_10185 [Myxococcota bacterium]|nr:hypothetical protein [Myxococcota bacterium]